MIDEFELAPLNIKSWVVNYVNKLDQKNVTAPKKNASNFMVSSFLI